MAAKDSFTGKVRGIGSQRTYLANYDRASFMDAARQMLEVVPTTSEVEARVLELIGRFASEFSRIASHMSKPEIISEFVSACKDRFQDLTRLNGIICTDAKDLDEVDVYIEMNSGTHQFNGRWSRTSHVYGLTIDDEILDLWSCDRRPGCYKWLFLADLLMISWAAKADSLECDAWEAASWYSTVICSIGRLYEDIRPNVAYVEQSEQEALSRLVATHDLDHESVYYQKLFELFDDIREGSKTYIRDISSALRKSELITNRQYSYRDYHLSMRKTGSKFKGKSYPGLYSALFESDQRTPESANFDDFTGYVSHYNQNPTEQVEQPGGKTISIEQHKVDRRIIHMGDNPRQDRLNYVHRRLQDFLNLLPEDCTKNQNRGIDFAIKVTDPAYRMQFGNNVYSLDISKATDTIDLEFQELCLRLLFPDEIVDYWIMISKSPRKFYFTSGKVCEYVQTCGQAQGYKSSFPSFAWCHHIVMRLLMLITDHTDMKPQDFYRVLGDDSIISCPDPTEEVLDRYIDICQWINWSTNRSKGYVAHSSEQYAFAEFAKKRVLNGVINTPIPGKLILNAEKTANGTIGLFQWISENYKALYLRDVWRNSPKLSSMYNEEEISFIERVASCGLLPCFDGWKDQLEARPQLVPDKEKMIYCMSYFLCKLDSTLIDQMLPDNLREVTKNGFDPSKLNFLLGTSEEEELFDLAEDSGNKYYEMIQLNSDMIDYINHVLYGGDKKPYTLSWIALELELTSQEEDRIFRCLEILDNFSRGICPNDVVGSLLTFEETNRILTRFNPRGDSRVSFQNGTLWTPVITNTERLLSMNFVIPE